MTDFDDIATLLAHDDDLPGHAIVPPIVQTSLFIFDDYAALEATFRGERKQPIYSRVGNPTVVAFEEKVAALEQGEAARGFASGMGAIATTVLSQLRAGDRLVAVEHIYPDAFRLFEKLLRRLGIETVYVDGRDTQAVIDAMRGARLLYLESPTSVVFELQDLATILDVARNADVTTVVDNSWATPLYQKPLTLGADFVVHSASKYIGGHSDTVAGVVAGSMARIAELDDLTYPYLGAKLAPFEAFLLLRGLRTLPLRMARHQASGLEVARWLAAHSATARVNHPGLREASGLAGSSGLFSVDFQPEIDIPKFCNSLRLFRLGVSWGGHESLAFPAMVGLQQVAGPNSLRRFGVSDRLVRLNIGLESPSDLIDDLNQALEAASQ